MNMPSIRKRNVNVGLDLTLLAKVRKVSKMEDVCVCDLIRSVLDHEFDYIELDACDMKWISEQMEINKAKRAGKVFGHGKKKSDECSA